MTVRAAPVQDREIHLAPVGRIVILYDVAFRLSSRRAKATHAQKGARS